MKGCVFVKKFLSRSIPVFLAVLILVGSLAVPALAAEIPPDYVVIPEESTISGSWAFKEDAASYDVKTWLTGDFYYNGVRYSTLFIDGSRIGFMVQYGNDPWVTDFLRDTDGNWVSSVRSFEIIGDSPCTDEFHTWFVSNLTELDYPLAISDDSIFSVFTDISGWIVSSIGTIMPMFYSEATGLTFVGTLAVAGLAFAVFFLIFAIIRRFMHFGG